MKRKSLFATLASAIGFSALAETSSGATEAMKNAGPNLAALKEIQFAAEGGHKFRPRPQLQKDRARVRRRARNKMADASRKRNWSPKARTRSAIIQHRLRHGWSMNEAVVCANQLYRFAIIQHRLRHGWSMNEAVVCAN